VDVEARDWIVWLRHGPNTQSVTGMEENSSSGNLTGAYIHEIQSGRGLPHSRTLRELRLRLAQASPLLCFRLALNCWGFENCATNSVAAGQGR